MGRIVTLTSDFGLADEFVGVMKGVILGREPATVIVDLSHMIAPQAILQAAHLLQASWSFFPAGSIHVAVVDPGVGSARRVVLLKAGGHFFLAPDNGLLSLVMAGCDSPRCWQVNQRRLFLDRVGTTFHGRDIFAPVAASLAGGLDPDLVGPRLPADELVVLPDLDPCGGSDPETLLGRVVQVDRFGNLITNIGRQFLRKFFGDADLRHLEIRCGQVPIHGLAEAYSAQPAGVLLALIGSRDTLELAVNQGRATELLGVGIGAEVQVTK